MQTSEKRYNQALIMHKKHPTYFEDLPIWQDFQSSDDDDYYGPCRSSYYSSHVTSTALQDSGQYFESWDDADFEDFEWYDDDKFMAVDNSIKRGATSFVVDYDRSEIRDNTNSIVVAPDRRADSIWLSVEANVVSPIRAREKIVMDVFSCESYHEVEEKITRDDPISEESPYPMTDKFGLMHVMPVEDSVVGIHQIAFDFLHDVDAEEVDGLFVLDDDRQPIGVPRDKERYARVLPVPTSRKWEDFSPMLRSRDLRVQLNGDESEYCKEVVEACDTYGDKFGNHDKYDKYGLRKMAYLLAPHVVESAVEADKFYRMLVGKTAFLTNVDVVESRWQMARSSYLIDPPTGTCIVLSSYWIDDKAHEVCFCMETLLRVPRWRQRLKEFIIKDLLWVWYPVFGRAWDPWRGLDERKEWLSFKKILPKYRPRITNSKTATMVDALRMRKIVDDARGKQRLDLTRYNKYSCGQSLRRWWQEQQPDEEGVAGIT
jgi:hypothetical protein